MPISYANSSYNGGHGGLTAQGYSTPTGLLNVADLLKNYRAPAPVVEAPQMDVGNQRAAMGALGSGPGPSELAQEQLKAMRLQNQDTEAKLYAKSKAAPTKQIFGFGMHGSVEDPEKFTGYQRELFLPQNAQISGGMPQSGAGLSPDMPRTPEGPDSGMQFRQGMLGEALKQSNANPMGYSQEFTAAQQRRGLQPPNSAYGR